MAAEELSSLESGLRIEPMRVRDLSDILSIERLSFTTPWSKGAFLAELLENDRAHYLVARVGEKAVGYIGVWIVLDEGHITNVAVHPDFRNRGIGRRLLLAIAELALSKGAVGLTLEVRRSNLRAQSLYRSLGFVTTGVRRGYYRDNNEDALIMWKQLVPDDDAGPGAAYGSGSGSGSEGSGGAGLSGNGVASG